MCGKTAHYLSIIDRIDTFLGLSDNYRIFYLLEINPSYQLSYRLLKKSYRQIAWERPKIHARPADNEAKKRGEYDDAF